MTHLTPLFPFLLTSALSTPVVAAGVHEHGRADLEIAVEAGQLDIRLAGPLDSFVGFEHRPRNDAQRATPEAARATLAAPGWLVEPTADAGCRLAAAEVSELPSDHDDDHAELAVAWRYACASPDALTGLTVRLGTRFPRLERLDAVFVGPAGQGAITLSGGRGRIDLR